MSGFFYAVVKVIEPLEWQKWVSIFYLLLLLYIMINVLPRFIGLVLASSSQGQDGLFLLRTAKYLLWMLMVLLGCVCYWNCWIYYLCSASLRSLINDRWATFVKHPNEVIISSFQVFLFQVHWNDNYYKSCWFSLLCVWQIPIMSLLPESCLVISLSVYN